VSTRPIITHYKRDMWLGLVRMSREAAPADFQLSQLLKYVRKTEDELEDAVYYRKVFLIAYITEARAIGKTFAWVGESLGVSANAIRRFYGRNNKSIGPADYARVRDVFGAQFYTPGRVHARTKLVCEPVQEG
jgi:hypothetical protein